jgi:succinate-semialdehyde dehydrogenase/glutarate-semialdehyde dehydrogenase
MQDTRLLIDGRWTAGSKGERLEVFNPATGEVFGHAAVATAEDIERAAAAAHGAFSSWSKVSGFERSGLLKAAAALLKDRLETIAPILTQEQGKPLSEARGELGNAVNLIEFFAEEARRIYGRDIPGRTPAVVQTVRKEPVGPVAAFTPWNFPVAQSCRKIAAGLAAGCTVVLKGSEETPHSVAALVGCFVDAGLPAGALNLLYGDPAMISSQLIADRRIRKVSFTGSTPVGKKLAALAGAHMKRTTFELGGHAPVLVFRDADIDQAAARLAGAKYRNAGQVCISPTRFLVEEDVLEEFTDKFVAQVKAVKVGNGLDPQSTMGPLANPRRIDAMERLVADAVAGGATLAAGGSRIGNAGNFFEPTVLTNVPTTIAAMNEEPFGPMALIRPFKGIDEALSEANRLDYGLAAYGYTRSSETAHRMASSIETGMLSINHHGLSLPETPFGGVKDSGYGSEGGVEAVEAYLNGKFVTHATF